MKSDFDIYVKGLIPLSIINFVYFGVEIFVIAVVCWCLSLFSISITAPYFIIISISIFAIGEYVHRKNVYVDKKFNINSKLINASFSIFYKILYSLNQSNKYLFLSNTSRFLTGTFCIFLVCEIFFLITNQAPLEKDLRNLNIFKAVPIIATISAFILPLIFNTISDFRDKYRNFEHLIQNLVKHMGWTLFFLTIYLLLSLNLYIKGSNENFDFLILIYSVYLLLTLTLIAYKASIILNFSTILVLHKNKILDLIKCLPEPEKPLSYRDKPFKKSEREIEKNINEKYFNKGWKNFIRTQIFGIIKRPESNRYENFIPKIKEYTDGLFNLANESIKNDNIAQLKLILSAISEVSIAFIPKKETNDDKLFEFISHKLAFLLDSSLERKNQEFSEYILESCEEITLALIEESQPIGMYDTTNFTSIRYFENKIKEFCFKTIKLNHTSTPGLSISALGKFIQRFSFKDEFLSAETTAKEIVGMAIAIKLLKDQKIIEETWATHLLNLCTSQLFNYIYYLNLHSVNINNQVQNRNLEKACEAFLKTTEIMLEAHDEGFGCPIISCLYGGNDARIDVLKTLLKRRPHIETPNFNMAYNAGQPYYWPKKLSSISEILDVIIVQDFDSNKDFYSAIKNYKYTVNLITPLCKIMLEKNYQTWADNGFYSLRQIIKTWYLFVERIEATNFNKKLLYEASNELLSEICSECIRLLKLFTEYEDSNNTSLYYDEEKFILFTALILFIQNRIINNQSKQIITDFISAIFNMYESLKDNQRERLYSAIKVIGFLYYEKSSNSDILNRIVEVLCNDYDFDRQGGRYSSNLEYIGFPHYSENLGINYNSANQYNEIIKDRMRSRE